MSPNRHRSRQLKKRYVRGRKPPQFATLIDLMVRDASVSIEEILDAGDERTESETGRITISMGKIPPGTTVVETLAGSWLFSDERVKRHLDVLEKTLREFSDGFLDPVGLSVAELQYDKKGRVWAEHHGQALALAYLAIAARFAEWTLPRDDWKNEPDKLPRIRFIFDKKGAPDVEQESE